MYITDVRWKQRFQNFEKAILQLRDAVSKDNLSFLEKAGLIQVFEFTFELGWKTVKDYLEDKEVAIKFPSDAIKEGFLYDIINDGDVWMDMLQKRNLMSHTYHQKNDDLACELIINTYFNELFIVYQTLQSAL